jgi:hypothetical protein
MNPSPLGTTDKPEGGAPKAPKAPKLTAPDDGPKKGPRDQFLPASYVVEHNGYSMIRTDN